MTFNEDFWFLKKIMEITCSGCMAVQVYTPNGTLMAFKGTNPVASVALSEHWFSIWKKKHQQSKDLNLIGTFLKFLVKDGTN